MKSAKKGDPIMKVCVDQDTCIGCGLCIGICPDVFDYNSDGKSVAKVDTVDADLVDSAKEAEEGCPVAAITVE